MTQSEGVEFHRLHPLTPFARGWQFIVIALIALGQDALRNLEFVQLIVTVVGVFAVAAVYGYLAWRFTKYRIEGDDLRVETGVFFRRTRHVRLNRLQAVEVVRPIVARLLGLAELRLEVAGGTSTEAPLAYLAEPDAKELRAELLARAAGVAPGTEEAPENVLVTVPTNALVTSIALSTGTVSAVAFSVVVLLGALILEAPAIILAFVPVALGLGGTVFREFSRHFDFTVAESPDGLRLRHGLLEHRAQTVPPGRLQSLRIVQPLLWRSRDWVRVQINIAGYGGGTDVNPQETSVLLPVAPHAVAHGLITRVLPGVDVREVPITPAPRRARWRRPVTWRALGCGATASVFVARRGLLRRELEVISHEKIQSVRVTQGPWERALRLATVHLDTTPGPVHVRADLRDVSESREIAESEAELARKARRAAGPERWMTRRDTADDS